MLSGPLVASNQGLSETGQNTCYRTGQIISYLHPLLSGLDSGGPGPYSTAPHAPVAQLDRVPGYEPGGRTFESCQARQFRKGLQLSSH